MDRNQRKNAKAARPRLTPLKAPWKGSILIEDQPATLQMANRSLSAQLCSGSGVGAKQPWRLEMTLVRKPINGTEYYTDDESYYTFHEVKVAADTLWSFACADLGITKKTGFTSQELKNITDLAGIGALHPTRFLLLKNGNAIPVPYLNGSSDLHPNDIILRSVDDPAVPTVIPPSVSTKNVADRLQEIEDLHKLKFLTDPEYQDKRAKIIAEL